jgi:succinate dehydrogenase / fumarate reductase cytochrome b subunit
MKDYFRSSIGRKQLMGISGLALSLFVLAHMSGNLLLFVGPEAYNSYSHFLVTNHFIYLAEAGLALFFLSHTAIGIRLTIENRKSRSARYALEPNGEKAVCPTSKTMIFHGLVIFAFTIHHLATFKFGKVYTATYGGVEMRDLYRLVTEVFHEPLYVVWYVVALLLLAAHLSHGFSSSFQSLGFYHPKHTRCLKVFGFFYAAAIAIGFLAPPLVIFFSKV